MSRPVMAAANLFDHFHEAVEDAIDIECVAVSDDTRLYLASMLTERARADRPSAPETTLAELHGRAAHAPPGEQARAYRELGDRALYLLGYFSESLSRRITGPNYYASMGRAAYHRTDVVLKAWFADAFGPVFGELSGQFDACVRVIRNVREHDAQDPVDPMVRLYEHWVETGSSEARERLVRRGLVLPSGEPVDC